MKSVSKFLCAIACCSIFAACSSDSKVFTERESSSANTNITENPEELTATEDNELPTATLQSMGNDLVIADFPFEFTGIATDDFSGIAAVEITVRSIATREHLQADGTMGPYAILRAMLTRPGGLSTDWTFNVTSLKPGPYIIDVRATDAQLNVSRWETTNFSVLSPTDNIAPTVAMQSLSSNPVITEFPFEFNGMATDNLSGVAEVEIIIRNTETTEYLQADGTMGSYVVLMAELDNPGEQSTAWSLGVASLPPGPYFIRLRAIDAESQVIQWQTTNFSVNEPPVNEPDVPNNQLYLSQSNPCKESEYLNLSLRLDSQECLPRLLKVGANVQEIEDTIDSTNVETVSECTPEGIQSTINSVAASARGGVVRIPACRVSFSGHTLNLKSNVILEGAGIDQTIFEYLPSTELSTTIGLSISNAAIQDLSIVGNNSLSFGIRLKDVSNVVIQRVSISNFDNIGIVIEYSKKVTVRYNDVQTGRDYAGNGTQRFQHGINSKDCRITDGSVEECAVEAANASMEHGVEYSYDMAVYSNNASNNDGRGISLSASNLESMGNFMNNNRWGSHYSHSMNLLIHNNYTGETPQENANNVFAQFFKINDAPIGYAYGVGYPSDDIFVFQNIFNNEIGGQALFEGIHGDVWMISNSFRSTTSAVVGNDPNSSEFLGTLWVCENDEDSVLLPVSEDNVSSEARTDICDLNVSSIIAEMNDDEPRPGTLHDTRTYPGVVTQPLPVIQGY